MISDYSYLKPRIAAKMPEAVLWFQSKTKKQVLEWVDSVGYCVFDERLGRLVNGWREMIIEYKANLLAHDHNQHVIAFYRNEIKERHQ